MSNKIQFDHNLKKTKRQREIERLKFDSCLYYGQQYENIKHNELIINYLLQKYIKEIGI